MKRVPVSTTPRPSYPRWGTRAAQSVRRMAVVGASSVILSVLGSASCAATSLRSDEPEVVADTQDEVETASSGPTEIAEVEAEPSNSTPATAGTPTKAQQQGAQNPEFHEEWVRLPVKIVFEQGSNLDESDHAMLRELMASVNHRTDVVRIRVEGYAIPEWEANHQGLAMARAEKVVDYLVIEGGMSRQFFELADAGGGYSDAGAMDRVQWQRVEFVALIRRSRSAH